MNAISETFSDHSRTSTHDIAFLTISDISSQLGISKSKLYKDIREGKLVAEKNLDDTLVVSPRALQHAYEKFDVSDLFEADFPMPEGLNHLDEGIELSAANSIPEPELDREQKPEFKIEPLDGLTTEISGPALCELPDKKDDALEVGTSEQNGRRTVKIAVLSSAVIICAAILVGVLRNF